MWYCQPFVSSIIRWLECETIWVPYVVEQRTNTVCFVCIISAVTLNYLHDISDMVYVQTVIVRDTTINEWPFCRMVTRTHFFLFSSCHVTIYPIAIAYSTKQIIKPMYVCQSVCQSVYQSVYTSVCTLTVAFHNRFSPKMGKTYMQAPPEVITTSSGSTSHPGCLAPGIKHPLSSVVFRKILKFIQQG